MAPRSGEPGSAGERRFFLERSPVEGQVELADGDREHAVRVLRVSTGDRLTGLDGRGGVWPLRVAAVERGKIALESLGLLRRDPAPGEPGAALPWIEIAVPWPKAGRAEEMLDRLAQLGAAAIGPLACDRAGPHSGAPPPARRARQERVLREACKQSGRTWLPVLREEDPPLERGADVLWLDPAAEHGLSDWIRERIDRGSAVWTSKRPLVVLVGPEGGFTESDRRRFLASGASGVRIGAHVLRVETAAEAAMAILAGAFVSSPRS